MKRSDDIDDTSFNDAILEYLGGIETTKQLHECLQMHVILEYLGGIETSAPLGQLQIRHQLILEYLGGIETLLSVFLHIPHLLDFRIPRRD